jgi:hypothetical protein
MLSPVYSEKKKKIKESKYRIDRSHLLMNLEKPFNANISKYQYRYISLCMDVDINIE